VLPYCFKFAAEKVCTTNSLLLKQKSGSLMLWSAAISASSLYASKKESILFEVIDALWQRF
jgi:hypothetical protein